MVPQTGLELEAAHLLEDQVGAPATRISRPKLIALSLSALLGLTGTLAYGLRSPSVLPGSPGGVVALASHEEHAAKPIDPVAVVPLVWTVITKQDGTGHLPEATMHKYVDLLNAHFAGTGNTVDVKKPDVAKILAGSDCTEKCNVAMCYKGGTATDLDTKKKVESECWCGADYCTHWGWKYDDEEGSALAGANVNTGVAFKIEKIKYVKNDEWHLQCCCTHADVKYETKQQEIFDQVVDKTTVRKVANIIVCDMSTLGGGTAGQSMITGTAGCAGGPGIMVDTATAMDVSYGVHTLVHEFGHNFGLHHTFNEECNGNWGCEKADVCKVDVNAGDHISDTPLHLKQEECNGADSCPDAPGKDPLDNYMSYSGCQQRRFTPKQVEKMHSVITKYYPEMLVSSDKPEAENFPCNPGFPSGEVPAGYTPPKDDALPIGDDPVSPPSCTLEVNQCDRFDTTGCYCQDARQCCADHGCGGEVGSQQCLPCSWKGPDTPFTDDSCK